MAANQIIKKTFKGLLVGLVGACIAWSVFTITALSFLGIHYLSQRANGYTFHLSSECEK